MFKLIFIILPIKIIFYVLDLIFPKDKKLILLASRSGRIKNANIAELAKELDKREGHRYFFVGSENSKNCLDYLSLKGILLILRAKYVFITHGPGDIKYAFYSPRKTVTYVGHGIPLKSFIFTNSHMKTKERILHGLEVPTYDFVVASSECDKNNLIKCFKKKEEDVIVTGLPRNDLLKNSSDSGVEVQSDKKIILYAPTYRDNQKFQFFPFEDVDILDFDDFLSEINAHVYLRSHVNDKNKMAYKKLKNIKLLNHKVQPEIQEFLPKVDLLISDYSSIYLDFLLVNKPIIFLCYDFKEYNSMRGFLYNYDEVSPGPKPKTYSELKKSIQLSLESEIESDEYYNERALLKKQFHQYENGNTKRLLDYVLDSKGVN